MIPNCSCNGYDTHSKFDLHSKLDLYRSKMYCSALSLVLLTVRAIINFY